MKDLQSYDFVIKYIKRDNNIGVDVLSRRLDYENYESLQILILKRKGDYLRIQKCEVIKNHEEEIKKTYDERTLRYQKVLKTLKRV